MRLVLIFFILVSGTLLQAETISGNSTGKITLIEYFDYNCPVCRGFAPTITRLILQNPELKVIQRAVPVLAPSSKVVDSVILATKLQGKFNATQNAILQIPARETLPFNALAATLRELGVDMPKLNKDMMSTIVQNDLKENLLKFNALNIHQIPVVLIFTTNKPGYQLKFVGSQSIQTLQSAINFLNQHGERYVKNINH